MEIISTLKQVWDLSDNQVTAQELLNGRLYLKGEGWTSVLLTNDFRNEIAENIAERLGGRQNTKNQVARVLKRNPHVPQHWGLSRFILQQVGERFYIGYVAGQDQQWESNEIRTYLKNV